MHDKKLWAALGLVSMGSLFACAHAQENQVVESPKTAPPKVAEAPQAAPVVTESAGDIQKMLEGTVLHFEFDQDLLTPESRERLDRIAEAMKSHSEARLKISGNCDERGTQEYNLALGQRRADVAKKYLVNLGVPAKRVSTVTYGDQKPVDPRHTEDAWAANRRDEIEPIR